MSIFNMDKCTSAYVFNMHKNKAAPRVKWISQCGNSMGLSFNDSPTKTSM